MIGIYRADRDRQNKDPWYKDYFEKKEKKWELLE